MIYIILCRSRYAKSMNNLFKDVFTLDLQTLFDDSCGTGNTAYILCAAGKHMMHTLDCYIGSCIHTFDMDFI